MHATRLGSLKFLDSGQMSRNNDPNRWDSDWELDSRRRYLFGQGRSSAWALAFFKPQPCPSTSSFSPTRCCFRFRRSCTLELPAEHWTIFYFSSCFCAYCRRKWFSRHGDAHRLARFRQYVSPKPLHLNSGYGRLKGRSNSTHLCHWPE